MGKGGKTVPGRGKSGGRSLALQSCFRLTLRQTAGAKKTSSPSGRVEGLGILGQTAFCLMDQTGLSDQSCKEYHSGPGTDIHYHSDLLVLARGGSTYTFGSNSNCHFGHWQFSVDQQPLSRKA